MYCRSMLPPPTHKEPAALEPHTSLSFMLCTRVRRAFSHTQSLPFGPILVFLVQSGSGRCVCECVKGLELQGEEVGD